MQPFQTLNELAAAVRTCSRCHLAQSRTKAVPGEGAEQAEIMLVGEAPGFHEDRQGRPFVGAAGRYLEELLASIGLQRQEVYITNVVKCRPPRNRNPLAQEIAACRPYLEQQITLIRPKLIVTLGRFSLQLFFPEAQISRVHGQPRKRGGIVYYPTYHPAAALYQPRWKALIAEDFQRIPALLAQAASLPEDDPSPGGGRD
ncbi:MAG: uracil-DNA glycosylase [Nitrospinota bacterium]|nr:MAG: uracil-DNA glycosylase [Nitrospinota bacterium]